MSFFKSLVLAIVATLFLTYVLGTSLLDLFDVDVYMGDELIEPLKAISFAALAAVVLVIVAMAIVLDRIWLDTICRLLLVVGALGLAAIGVFWPVLAVAFIIRLVMRDDKRSVHSQ